MNFTPDTIWSTSLGKCDEQVLLHDYKVIRIQRLINIRISKAYCTVSNKALCVITGLMPVIIKIAEAGKYYEITKSKGMKYDRETEVKNWIHPAKFVNVVGQEKRTHSLYADTDSSKNDIGVRSGIAIFSDNCLKNMLEIQAK
jgi:hypothetical protein